MPSPSCLIVLCALLSIACAAEVKPPSAEEVGALERFISLPTSRVIWSKHVDRIAAAEAEADITAIVAADTAQARQMPGVRIEFTSPGMNVMDRVYIAEEFVKRLIEALSEIETQAGQFLSRSSGSSPCFGSGAFLQAMRQGAHFFHASQCSMSDGWSGLSVSTGTGTFRFAGLNSAPFRIAITRAAAELKRR